MATETCPSCEAELKADILGGLCPKCVLKKVMAAPEGESAGMSFMSLFRIGAGKILETWMKMDRMGMREQLARLPDAQSPSGSNR